MENKTIGIILGVAIAVFIGAMLIQVIASSTQDRTTLTTKTENIDISAARLAGGTINESKTFTLATGVGDWRNDYSECIPQTIVLTNQTGGKLTDPTDYVYVYNGGTLTFADSVNINSSLANNTIATYDYCPDGYVAQSWGRNVLNLIVGFFAFALLGVVIYLVYYIFKANNIDIS